MKILKNFYNFFVKFGDGLQDYFLLAIRLIWGSSLAYSGYEKLITHSNVVKFFSKINIPYPDFTASLVGYVEFIGGICIVLGLLSRIIPIPLVIVMAVAFFTTTPHTVNDYLASPTSIMKENSIPFLFVFLIIWAFGPGRFSLDRYIGNHVK